MPAQKRSHVEHDGERRTEQKRIKTSPHTEPSPDHLSRLPDELIVRVLSFLGETELLHCQLISKKYHRLAGDRRLWKALFYDRFVRPRVRRLRGTKEKELGSAAALVDSESRSANWLDEAYLLDPRLRTDWKRQFRVRFNWSNGNCTVRAVSIGKANNRTPVLVQLRQGLIYMVHEDIGLQIRSAGSQQATIVTIGFADGQKPTALAVDGRGSLSAINVLVGFQDGRFALYCFDVGTNVLTRAYIHGEAPVAAPVTSATLAWPFALVMTGEKSMSLYRWDDRQTRASKSCAPDLLHRLESSVVHKPLSMSLRTSATSMSVSIAFTTPTPVGLWTIGIQEVRISHDDDHVESHLDYALDGHHPLFCTEPSSMSYSHPYLLASHSDNTMTLYLVHSGSESLQIGRGSQLWGHTSGISHAQVGARGRAVSVSAWGGEVRLWELEGGLGQWSRRSNKLSVRIQPRDSPFLRDDKHRSAWEEQNGEDASRRRWVGFDDENVVLLHDGRNGEQMLVIYNFA